VLEGRGLGAVPSLRSEVDTHGKRREFANNNDGGEAEKRPVKGIYFKGTPKETGKTPKGKGTTRNVLLQSRKETN